jgi:hypothetical protein
MKYVAVCMHASPSGAKPGFPEARSKNPVVQHFNPIIDPGKTTGKRNETVDNSQYQSDGIKGDNDTCV